MVAYGVYEADSNVVATRMLDSWDDACDYYGVKSHNYPMTLADQKCVCVPCPTKFPPLICADLSSSLACPVIVGT